MIRGAEERSIAMMADLTGKVCLITGATAGIGRATAQQLATMGAEMYLVSRSRERGLAAVAEIIATTRNNQVHLLVGDLAALDDVRRLVDSFQRLDRPLHLLLNNAGVMNTSRKLTVDGFEEMFAVNHLAHFLLTSLLLDQLRAAAPARVVTVASDAYTLAPGMNFSDLNFDEGFRTLKVYGHSKLANILFSQELARRLDGTSVTSNALHPGSVSTQLGTQNGWRTRALQRILRPFLKSPERGADTSVFVSVAPELHDVTGIYFAKSQPQELKTIATDVAAGERLWEISCAMTADQGEA